MQDGSTMVRGEGRFPEKDGAARPETFIELIGQNELVDNLKIFVQAAKERGDALDHVLLCGPPGLGKTTIAHLIARELEATIHVTSGPALERKDLAGVLSQLGPRDVLFIDEIHRLSPVVEEILYPAMEDFKFDLVLGTGPHARTLEMKLPRFTLVGATTRTGLLTGPLRDRFGYTGRFRFYSVDELLQVVLRTARVLGIACTETGASEIARRSRGTPRIANRMLRRVRDFAEIAADGTVDQAIADHALSRMGIDTEGFDELDRGFIETVVRKFDGGPVGIDTLGASMGEQADTLEFTCEPYLLQQGFIKRTPRGRVATLRAFSYLGDELPQPVVQSALFAERSTDA